MGIPTRNLVFAKCRGVLPISPNKKKSMYAVYAAYLIIEINDKLPP